MAAYFASQFTALIRVYHKAYWDSRIMHTPLSDAIERLCNCARALLLTRQGQMVL